MRVARQNPASGLPSGRGYYLTRRSSRRTDGAVVQTARPLGHRRLAKMAPVQEPSYPSRPTCGPPRRLLFLLLQQQLDPLPDERRGLLVPRVRDQPPHEVPRRLIQAEGDDSGFCFHSLSSFACGHDRRLSPFQSGCIIYGRLGRKCQRRAATARFRTIQIYPKDIGHVCGHTRSINRPALFRFDASGPKGGRS